MDKIAINLVGGAAGDADYGLRLYNVGNGFVGVTGKVVSRLGDSMFINFTAERRYTIAVEGDLVLSTETDDSFAHKTEGVYGFDVDWSETARNFGNGTGKIFVTNPDSPNDVSVFEVFMGVTPSAAVEFKPNTGKNGTVVVRGDIDLSAVDPVMKNVLSAPKYDDPYACGMALVSALLPAIGFDYGRLFDINVHRTEDNMSKPDDGKHLVDSVIADGNVASGEGEVYAHEYHRPDYRGGHMPESHSGAMPESHGDTILTLLQPEHFCARFGADCAFVDAMLASMEAGKLPLFGAGTSVSGRDFSDHAGLVVQLPALPDGLERATIEDLLGSYGDDGDVKLEADLRDFGQLARTRQHDIDSIERAVAAANALGIDTSDIASKRDELLAKLAVFCDRFETGGKHEVTTDEAAVINSVFGELFGIHQDLDTCVSHWHHYKQQIEVSQKHWADGLAARKRHFRLADDSQDNRIATGYVDYAAKPEETLEASKAALVELFQAIQRRDLRAAHEAANKARQFGTREHFLASLIRRGVLVAVEESAAA